MFTVNAGVVGEHEFLIAANEVEILTLKEHSGSMKPYRLPVGEVAQIVDDSGDKNEKHEAEQAVFQKRLKLEAAYAVYEPYDRKPRTGVEAAPLAGDADAEGDARKRKVSEPAAAYIQVHEQVHKQDEKHGVAVYRRNAGLREMHEVEGEYRRAAGGNRTSSSEERRAAAASKRR